MLHEHYKKIFIEKYGTLFQSTYGKSVAEGNLEEKYNALVLTLREHIAANWIKTRNQYQEKKVKQVYYFCIEYLPGRLLDSYLVNTGFKNVVKEGLAELGIELDEVERQEKDIALGSGGLGRLAACFLDAMASTSIPGHGCGISYKYGLFQQKIIEGNQVEFPDRWISTHSPWQFIKRDKAVEVKFGGNVTFCEEEGRLKVGLENYESVLAVPYDIPIVGYGNKTVNNLRLWSAEVMPEQHNFALDNQEEYKKAAAYKQRVEAISEALYPDDSNYQGKLLRLKQQYFMVSAGMQSILNYYKKKYAASLQVLDEYIAVHINDTHPTLIIPELMRLLIDEEGFTWEEAWRITKNTVSYTNHTILPEALEKWPLEIVRELLPRILQIIEEIDRRIRIELELAYPNDPQKINSMAVIHDGQVHMASLAIHGSYSVNGVARIHTEILKKDVLKNFYEYYGNKFNNKTNGITHRRWLLSANPQLSKLLISKIGNTWIAHPDDLKNLLPCGEKPEFLEKLIKVKRSNKEKLAEYIQRKNSVQLDVNSIFDVQIKRIHAYKRQLLNALYILYLYTKLKKEPELDIVPRTFIFAGKAAPSYYLAKAIIKFINVLGLLINNDPEIKDKIKVVFLENYSVSLAELIIPAAEVSEQISTASKEASGTGNMKMMMNGAITLGTLDGANIEIKEEVGEANFVTFGMTADEVISLNETHAYSSTEQVNADPRLKEIMEWLDSKELDLDPQTNMALKNYFFSYNDEFYVLKDFDAYVKAQEKINKLYKDQSNWQKMATVNIAKAGKFSADRTIWEYAVAIWQIEPVKIE